MRARVAAVLLLAGCGRVGFDVVDDAAASIDAVIPPTFELSIGSSHACAIRETQLYCWGRNLSGELGLGFLSTTELPTQVAASTGWHSVSVGDDHTCAIQFGILYCWGQNAEGELGIGPDTGNIAAPAIVGVGWKQVACRENHCCGLRTDGEVMCWGGNDGGEVGVPGINVFNTPTAVAIGTGWERIFVGFNYGIAIGANERLVFWGSDEEGQRGDGLIGGRDHPPAELALGITPVLLAPGREHLCASTAGELWCWGDNRAGQIGNGLTGLNDQASPFRLTLSSPPISVGAGEENSCAVVESGLLFCWGDNTFGQLGNGVSGPGTEEVFPELVAGDSTWTDVTLGNGIVCGERSNGVFCWGNNSGGVLGVTPSILFSTIPLGPLVF